VCGGLTRLSCVTFCLSATPCAHSAHTHTHTRARARQADFRKAKEKVLYKKKEGVPEGLYM
jgi:hypothetical protein